MARLLVHVEGQTEENFVNEVLRDHLVMKGYHSVEARIIGNTRLRGGIRKWPLVRKGILNHLREDPACVATTMVDYYALPHAGPGGWPGREESEALGTAEKKGQFVQNAVRDDLATEIGHRFDSSRFVPFIVMHEFEGLLFSDCTAFTRLVGRPELKPVFLKIRSQFASPEDINDSPDTAPSKRIRKFMPEYQKPLFGVLAMLEIGLSAIRAECPHFDAWLTTLESHVHEG